METKIDNRDVTAVPGYLFISQQRQQLFSKRRFRKSGGIGVFVFFFRNSISAKIQHIHIDSNYILWLKFDRTLFNIKEDFFFQYSLYTTDAITFS